MMSIPRCLILNADGYGFTPGVNAGIISTFEAGLVSSTSCTPNFGFLADAGNVQRRFPDISFGIHFNLSVGKPLTTPSKIQSLVNEKGEFIGSDLLKRIIKGKVQKSEMEMELSAQAAVLADQGVKISHFDGHQNRHLWPVYFESCIRVAKHFNIGSVRCHRRSLYNKSGPLSSLSLCRYYAEHPKRMITHKGGRMRTAKAEKFSIAAADRLITPGYTDDSHKSLSEFWYTLADTLPTGYSEVYCHPGFPDEILRANAYYVEERAEEARVLSDSNLKDYFRERKVKIINFWDLRKVRCK